MTAPFREEFVDANVPDRKLAALGRCPWCATSISVDPNEVDGVCTACGARYATELALTTPPAPRRRRRASTAPAAPAEESPDPIHVAAPRPPPVLRDLDADERAERARTIFIAMVWPGVFTLIFFVLAVRAWLR